ncbi:TPA: hypothetical protein JAW23_002701 [Citrobacter koseri]|uniref:hypothetical protein n=1 Tax=Citrobacter TaxID=544 RepID=UPI000FDC00F6|nr:MULTISPECIES: hypothetical protein [Citrobacter]EKX8767150.1 hypothetical protein [Citrobacter koseri]ELJ2667427.1 hypothetical protein [Citrobacter koseri]MBJ8806339.1 hypothetical protein [Citrobacter koseri]MBJ8935799.1 hypothetical protein [Citrobacter koseri]MBJ9646733.1 hypothetical protein [Citrobacter koseri]
MATQRVLSGLQPGAFGIAGWRRKTSYPAYSLVHWYLPDGDAMRLIRPTAWCIWYCRMATQRVLSGLQPGAFGIAGWRRNASYPAYRL